VHHLTPGTILKHRYKITGVLDAISESPLYQARDLEWTDVNRLVAIREVVIPTKNDALHQQIIDSFQQKATQTANLNHPAIVEFQGYFNSYDRMYLVMKYVYGSSLELLMDNLKEPLPVNKVIEWAIDLCGALNYLHSQQPEPIVFCDVTPAHILIDSLARVTLRIPIEVIVFTMLSYLSRVGTEGYAAPELYARQITPLTDIYSLGATLHHTLTRSDPRLEPPFSFLQRPIKQYNPNVPDALAEIIDKAVQFDPKDRWQSAAEMKAALESL